MSSHPTFHTPSFGDEEFHIPSIQNSSNLSVRGDINVSGNRTSGVQAVTDMTTTNINSSAADTHSATETIAMSNFSGTQWPTSYQAKSNSMQSGAGVVTMTGNDFLVLRSPHQQQQSQSNSSSDIANSSSAHMTAGPGVIDQGISSDEDDDGSLSRAAGNRSPGGKAAIVDLKSRLKNDPNAPRKPVSAYALFFGDTQAAIKGQNPNASFAEVSKIVASMWDVLAPEHKEVYKKKADDAKKEYRRLMSTYLSSLAAKSEEETRQKVGKEAGPQQHHSDVQQPQAVSATVAVANATQSSPGTLALPPHHSQSQSQTTTAATTPISTPDESNEQGVGTAGQDPTNSAVPGQTCIRNGCQNQAIVSPDWEDEYCSNECVVSHCAEIFSRWVQDNSGAEAYTAS